MLTNLILTLALTNSSILPSVLPADGKILYVGNNSSFEYKVAKKEENKGFKEVSSTLLANNAELIYKDMFIATKENLGYHAPVYNYVTNYDITSKEIQGHYDIAMDNKGIWRDVYIPGYTQYTTNSFEVKTFLVKSEKNLDEANPIAKWFFDRNIWEPTYILAMAFNYSVVEGLNQLDSTGISGYVFTLGLTCAETYAINTWSSYLSSDFYFEAPLFSMKF